MIEKISTNELAIAVTVSDKSLLSAGLLLAKKLHLPFIDNVSEEYAFVLVKTLHHLELQEPASKNSEPFFVDFQSPKMRYRIAHGGKEAIAKAVGLKKHKGQRVIDATAGFGNDGFILANLGCSVLLLERSPIVAALLEDGISRVLPATALSLQVRNVDALTYLQKEALEDRPDVIYLDPMFPPRKKAAKVKKHMQILSQLADLSDDFEEAALLNAALLCATSRVVVKRPKTAAFLALKEPSMMIKTNDYRFDVYIV